jgi:hypothetical protein
MSDSWNEDEPLLRTVLAADLTAFAVPGTTVELTESTDGWTGASWERKDNRRKHAEFLLRGPIDFSDVIARDAGGERPYRSFLSDAEMADLYGLARALLGTIREEPYVPSEATLNQSESNGGTTPTQADLLLSGLAVPGTEVTRLLFLTGGAGGGKTSLLEHLVRLRASDYRQGAGGPLWMYVNAQGRRLARIDDAINADLAKLFASFNFDGVCALVRSGALVLAVDGFDELLGIAGSYDESFSSLASFLGLLHGAGCVVAAARSAYYEQEFVTRVDRAVGFRSEGWRLERVRLLDWGEVQRREYVELLAPNGGFDTDSIVTALEEKFSSEGITPLAGNPFFVTRTIKLLTEDQLSPEGPTLLERLVNSYLEREAEDKLRERPGKSYLTRDQLRTIFAEVAEEMWRQNTGELSRTSFRELLAFLAELEGLDTEAQLAVVDRGPYSAVLKSGMADGSVTFEHDVYFAYFLSGPLVEVSRGGEVVALRQALRRSSLPIEASLMAGEQLANDLDVVLPLYNAVCAIEDPYSLQIRQNAGYVLSSALRAAGSAADIALRNIAFVDCDLRDVSLRNVELTACAFIGSDLSAAVIRDSEGHGLSFDRIRVDARTTRLGLAGVGLDAFRVLIAASEEPDRTIYDPLDLRNVLAQCELPAASDNQPLRAVSEEVVSCLEALSHLLARANLFSEWDEIPLVRRITEVASWPKLRRVLVSEGVLVWDTRPARGRKTFLRAQVAPNDLMAGRDRSAIVPGTIRSLWDQLEMQFPMSAP